MSSPVAIRIDEIRRRDGVEIDILLRVGRCATMQVSKSEAARRQLEAAIRMYFDEEDPVALHTVIAAPFTIVRNLCEQRGDIASFQRFSDWIVPGAEGKFWSAVNSQANFLKHADRDASATLDFNEEVTELLILMTAKWFLDLGNASSAETKAFGLWYSLMYPKVLKEEALQAFRDVGAADFYQKLASAFARLDALDRVRAGKEMLRQIRQHEREG